jgi:plasmid maintenance system antidote protein VapI
MRNTKLLLAIAERDLTHTRLAEQCGIRRETISRVLNCRVRPKPKTAIALAAALDTTPMALGFGESEVA